MKNLKSAKLLVMILSVALLIGAIAAVATSAAEDDTYAIKSINISHDDSIMVLLAVDALGVDPATIEVKYTIGNGEAKKATYYKNVDIYKDGNSYPVFYTEGIPMKDMGEDVKAEAHKVGTTPAAPKYKDTSVATYLFTKLYGENYISASEGENLGRKNLYLNLLSYGAQAQQVLWNNKHPEAIRTLVTDLVPVYVEGATVNDKSGLMKLTAADYLDLKYTGSDLLVGWKVTSESGVKTYYNNVYVSEGARVTPITVSVGDAMMDFEDATVGAGISTAWVEGSKDADGKYTQSITTVGEGSTGGITPTYTTETDIRNGRIATGGTYVLIKEDADGNKYLDYKTVGRTNYTGYTGNRSNPPGFNIPVTDIDADANVTVWSFDAIFDGTACSGPAQIMFTTDSGANIIYPYINEGNTIKSSDGKAVVATFPSNKLVNIKFEYYFVEGVIQVFIDGEYQGNFTNTYKGSASTAQPHAKAAKIAFGMDGSSAISVKIDNMLAVNVKKDFSAFPYTLKQPVDAYDFEDETAGVIGSTKSGLATYTFGDSGLTVNNNRPSTHTYPNKCTDGVEIVEEANGNKYFYMYAGKRVDTSNDRGWSFSNRSAAVKLVPDNFADLGVLELDMKIDKTLFVDGANQGTGNGMINWTWYFSGSSMSSNAVRMDPKVSGDSLTLAGNTFMTFDAWYTVRLEFNRNDSSITVYSKLRGEKDWSRTFTIPSSYDTGTLASYGKMANISAGAFTGFDITGGNSGQMYSLSFDNISAYSTIDLK